MSSIPLPSPPQSVLKTVIVMDYQNVHLTGSLMYFPDDAAHLHLIHPVNFANRLLSVRNGKQEAGRPHAKLLRVEVHRGLPDATVEPRKNAWNIANSISWKLSSPLVEVHTKPLKYEYLRDALGRKCRDVNGKFMIDANSKPQEKGVDVQCALAVVLAAMDPKVDLVILASRDTDLIPALDAAYDLPTTKIETTSWAYSDGRKYAGNLRPTPPRRMWNTALNEVDYVASEDKGSY